MRMTRLICLLGMFATPAAMAAGGALDVTITVVDSPADLPAAVTSKIELPTAASSVAGERSAKGLSTANDARQRGRDFGQDIAEAAKVRGKGKVKP